MYDIIFCSLPFGNIDHIYNAPAILKGVVKSHGYKAKTVDFSLMLFDICNNDTFIFDQVQTYFISPNLDKNEYQTYIDKFYDECLDFFKSNPTQYIGLSVLSIYTHKSTYELLIKLKSSGISSKIILGGRGIKIPIFAPVYNNLQPSAAEKILTFGNFILKRKLADSCIIGDGEDAILDILADKQNADHQHISEQFRTPVPDYEDYNFSKYLTNNRIILPVTGSKGCVRDCDFCDIKFQFGKYRYRSGKDIATEILELSKMYDVTQFQFTDSLVNGGLKPFKEFLEIIAEYNDNNPDRKISWSGQYICRPAAQTPEEIYYLMAKSGAEGITIGAESGSDNVLAHMNKKTTVQALFDELEQFRKYGITCTILTFVGHWSETEDDFIEHCKMFIKLAPYVRSGTVAGILGGVTMAMLDGTPSMFDKDLNQITLSDFNKDQIWIAKQNKSSTFKERVKRRLIIDKICKKLNLLTINDSEFFLYMKNIINTQHEQINEFYDQHL